MKQIEYYRWLGNTQGVCYECATRFDKSTLLQRADLCFTETKISRRAICACPNGHNRADIAILKGDWEWSDLFPIFPLR